MLKKIIIIIKVHYNKGKICLSWEEEERGGVVRTLLLLFCSETQL